MGPRTRYILIFIGVITMLWYLERQVVSTPDDKEVTADLPAKFVEFSEQYLPTSTSGLVVQHNFYDLSYSREHGQAEWVAYELQPGHVRANSFDRPYFEKDTKVPGSSAHWRNYKNSGYDRGHLCPAADRSFSYEAYRETFLTSNISPQDPEFNAGVWNRLEQKVRYWASDRDGLLVVTGAVLKPGLKTIGKEEVSVPQYFYKILLDDTGNSYKMLAFLVPHEQSQRMLYDFAVSVDQLEALTGIDFFGILPDELENVLEASVDRRGW